MLKIILVIIIGISILTVEYLYFCNRYYTSEIADGNYIMKIKSKPTIKDKVVVGSFSLIVTGNMILLGWFAYREQRKRNTLSRNPVSCENIDY